MRQFTYFYSYDKIPTDYRFPHWHRFVWFQERRFRSGTFRKGFEGIIKYHITYKNNKDSGFYVGDTLLLYYSKGNLIKQFNGKFRLGLKKEIFLSARNEYYMSFGSSDALYSYDLTKEHDTKLDSMNHSSTGVKILGYPCEKIEFHNIRMGPTKYYITTSYWSSKQILPVDRKYFKKWKYGSFDKFIDEAGSLYLQYQIDIQRFGQYSLSTRIYTAFDIKEQALDEKMFTVDATKVKDPIE